MKARTVLTLVTAFAGLVLVSFSAWAAASPNAARSTPSAQLAAQALPFSFDEVVAYFHHLLGSPSFKADDRFCVFVDSDNSDESLSPPKNRKSLSYFLRLAISALITSESLVGLQRRWTLETVGAPPAFAQFNWYRTYQPNFGMS